MKQKSQIILIFILVLSFSIISFAAAAETMCLKSSDDYASEVVLNKPGIEYNLNYFSSAQNVILREGKYSFLSHSSDKLLVVISEVDGSISGGLPGLSVRLQIPTVSYKENVHTLDLLSKSVKGKIIAENVSDSFYGGWGIDCTDERIISECKFIRDDMRMRAYFEEGQYKIELQMIKNVNSCDPSCDGYCIRSGGESTCIDSERMSAIEDVLKHSGLIRDFNEFIGAYSIVQNGEFPISTVKPESEIEVNWGEAMKAELDWLRSEGVLRIAENDIGDIASVVEQGNAGQNNRIVNAKNRDGVATWIEYKDSISPSLSFEKECSEYTISPGITGGVTFESGNPRIYYLLPIGIILILFLIFTLIVVFTRWNHERLKNQRHAIDKELTNVDRALMDRERKGKR